MQPIMESKSMLYSINLIATLFWLLLPYNDLVIAIELKDLLMDTTTTIATAITTTTTTTTTTTLTTPTIRARSDAYVVSAAIVPAYTAANILTNNITYKAPMNGNILMSHPPSALKTPIKYFNKSSPKKRKADEISALSIDDSLLEWKCPNITGTRSLECGCDLPHTLRCNGDLHGLTLLAKKLRESPYSISLLDCSLRNVTYLSDAKIFDGLSLHGLVISSGEIKRVHKSAFLGIKGPLQALGLPGNALLSVPWNSISSLTGLERLDLSNNKIKVLGTADFVSLVNLIYLELSNNQISSISQRTFINLRKLEVLKLGGNRLGDYAVSLKALSQCFNLRQLDLTANNLNGPLSAATLPGLSNLESLNLNRNMIKSIQNKALQNFSHLKSLSLRHNQIDVLQDHAFYGLGSLENLDLSYNGIVAISSASLQHLTRLTVLDLTHNFLRALTSDLIIPLPSLKELRLAGNDISIVAKNALDGARELRSLSMQENPLSCDCTIRPFAEWLQMAKIHSQDLIGVTCVTPPRLEGAPLIQVPIDTLNCDMDNVEKDNANIIQHLESFTKQNQSTFIRDLSEEILLHELHYSADYGLILTWILNLNNNDYMCDSIFVYKEENINEILIDNSPIQCESKIINGQNTMSVIVPDSSALSMDESYRFCLVIVQEHNPKADLNIGCSNITKLVLSSPGSLPENRQMARRPYYVQQASSLSTSAEDLNGATSGEEYLINGRHFNTADGNQAQPTPHASPTMQQNYDFIDSLNRSFLPGLGLGILVTSVVVLIWGATRIRHNASSTISSGNPNNNNNNNHIRPNTPTATMCYAVASEHIARLADPENGSRYLKLQATTSL